MKNFLITFRTMVLGCLFLIAGCTGGGDSPAGKVDNTPPQLNFSLIPISGTVSGEVSLSWTIEDDNPLAVEILLSKDSGSTFTVLATIFHTTDKNGSYIWNTDLPATPDGDGYQLKLVAKDIPNNQTEIVSPIFSISNFVGGSPITPSIEVTAPTGISTLHGTANITWTSNIVNQGTVDILLSSDNGKSFPTTIASGIGNTGLYTWDSSAYTGKLFQFRLTLTKNGVSSPRSDSNPDIQIDNASPVAVDPVLHFSNPTSDGITISWAAAEDSISAQNNLQYRLYYSDANNISTPALINIYGTDVIGNVLTETSYTVTGITNAVSKYWNVVAVDEVDLRASYTATQPTGIPVLSFGNNGTVIFDHPETGRYDYGEALVIDNNGKLVVVGQSSLSLDTDLMIWRYDKLGNLDLTFGDANSSGSGKIGSLTVKNPINGGGDYVGKAVVIDASGKIVVAGYGKITATSGYDIVVWRFLSDGSPDPIFNTTGMVHYDHPGSDKGWSVAIDSQGRIIVSGELYVSSGDVDMVLLRYDTFGVLDTTFGSNGNGIVTHDSAAGGNSWDSGESVAIDSKNNIVVAGYSTTPSGAPSYSNSDLAVWRFTSNGVPDPSFGNNANDVGVVTHQNAAGMDSNDTGLRMVIDNNDNIVVVGDSVSTFIAPDSNIPGDSYTFDYDMVIWRFTSSGQLDNAFNGRGFVVAGLNEPLVKGFDTYDRGWSVGIDNNNKIVVAGQTDTVSGGRATAIWRYLDNGDADSGFGDNGFLFLEDPTNSGTNHANSGIALSIDKTDNSYFIAGSIYTGVFNYDMMLLHYQ